MPGNSVDSLLAAVRALADGYTQHQRILRLTLAGFSEVLLAESLHGEEELSRGYRLEVAALSLDANIALKSLLGQPALLELRTGYGPGGTRPFHGHVSAAELVGANGGFARYRLTIEPWTAFLRLGRDSRIFQDQSVLDILETVFAAYHGKGTLAPAWRLDIADPEVYARRSITTQYQESDLAFVERLMSEEGLFYFFEHDGDAASPSLGLHTLVIADHNGAFLPSAQADVRFTQSGAVMREDSMDRWRTELRMQASAVEVASWDYRTLNTRPVSAAVPSPVELTSRDMPGAYAYSSSAHGDRSATRQLEALQVRQETYIGAGTVRGMASGTTFTLHEHSKFDGGDDARFAVVRVRHLAHNNLNADTSNSLERLLGACPVRRASLAELATSLHATGRAEGTRPVYRNRTDAIRASTPYRSPWFDEHGALLHPRPNVAGQQTAIVVGPPGAPIHTDRDHRVKVQFHWQRGNQSHSRLAHPAPDGHTGAPADDLAGTWVRVVTPLAPVAGANWGGHGLPRVGQEVLVDFIDGNIDRPVVIGSLYNGSGETDAQHNRVRTGAGAATGNAPTWFAGGAGQHAHAAVLSGLKTQAMAASQSGTGAYNQLVFDDTPGEPRTALQRHAAAHAGTDELNLGHLRHQADNQRLDPAGFGAELKTEHSAALRAGQGLLLSTDARQNAASTQIDSSEALAQLGASLSLQQAMAETAQKHNARLRDEPEPAKLPAIDQLEHAGKVLEEQASGGTDSGGAGEATAYGEPLLQLSSPAGIAAVTPASAIVAAGATTGFAAGQDINFASQANSFHQVKAGISLFTYGKASAGDKPNQETGIRLHAASGKVSMQSQSDATRITADKSVTVASVSKSVTVSAPKHVMLTAQGAYLKIEGGNIMIHGPGTMSFKASMKELAGPQSTSVAGPEFKVGELKGCAMKLADATQSGAAGVAR
jgi:type VI secretion system secreted protein VgrG